MLNTVMNITNEYMGSQLVILNGTYEYAVLWLIRRRLTRTSA